VSNAVLHGHPSITLEIRVDPPRIGVAVADDGAAFPVPSAAPPDPAQTSGRGLVIVDRLASRWGIEPNQPGPGKTVWFELSPQ
jgi:anti-sigma regulatory factor (Ser/Thr protein kinase)